MLNVTVKPSAPTRRVEYNNAPTPSRFDLGYRVANRLPLETLQALYTLRESI